MRKLMRKLRNLFTGQVILRADLRGADWQKVDLQGANLEKTDLSEIDVMRLFGGADLRRASLLGADLRGANLLGADLREAKDREVV